MCFNCVPTQHGIPTPINWVRQQGVLGWLQLPAFCTGAHILVSMRPTVPAGLRVVRMAGP